MSSPRSLMKAAVKNSEILLELQNDRRTRTELADALDVSRKTVYRKTKELAEFSLLTQDSNRYELTKLGEFFVNWYADTYDIVEELCEHPNLREHFEESGLPFDVLRDVTIVSPSSGVSYDQQETVNELFERGSKVRVLLPVVSTTTVETLLPSVADGNVRGELLFTADVVQNLTENYSMRLRRIRENSCEIRQVEATVSYGIVLVDEPEPEIAVTLYDETNRLHTVLRSRTGKGMDWVKQKYRKWMRNSVPVEVTTTEAAISTGYESDE